VVVVVVVVVVLVVVVVAAAAAAWYLVYTTFLLQFSCVLFAVTVAMHCASHFILLQELGACGLSHGYAGKFRSYITDRLHDVGIANIITSPFTILP